MYNLSFEEHIIFLELDLHLSIPRDSKYCYETQLNQNFNKACYLEASQCQVFFTVPLAGCNHSVMAPYKTHPHKVVARLQGSAGKRLWQGPDTTYLKGPGA